jgi:glutamate--cysteine ligase
MAIIQQMFTKAGFEVRIGTLLANLKEPKEIDLPSGKKIKLEPVVRENNRLMVGEFSPCLILLNNDLSSGVPAILQDLDQLIMPPLYAGWYLRLKSQHFQYYEEVATEFCHTFDIDPWLLSSLFRNCKQVNFMSKEGEHCLIEQAHSLFQEIRDKYKQYNIPHNPFLVVKADRGTYGMAVLMIKRPEDLVQLNRKERTKMASNKGGQEVTQVIIQEGVYTFETWGREQSPAEPVIYMIGKYVVGGFYRVHAGKGTDENLNAPGMNFEPLAFVKSCNNPTEIRGSSENRFYAYGVVARLALIAASRELKMIDSK